MTGSQFKNASREKSAKFETRGDITSFYGARTGSRSLFYERTAHTTRGGKKLRAVTREAHLSLHAPHSGSAGTCQVITCWGGPPGGMGTPLHSEVTYLTKVVLYNAQSSQGNVLVLMKLQSLDSVNPTKFFDQETQVFSLWKLLCCLGVGERSEILGKSPRGCSLAHGSDQGSCARTGSLGFTFPTLTWLSSCFGYLCYMYLGFFSPHKIHHFFFLNVLPSINISLLLFSSYPHSN